MWTIVCWFLFWFQYIGHVLLIIMELSSTCIILKFKCHFKYSKVVTVAIESCHKSCKYIIWIDMDYEMNSYVTKWIPCLDIIWLNLDNFIAGMLYLLCVIHQTSTWNMYFNLYNVHWAFNFLNNIEAPFLNTAKI